MYRLLSSMFAVVAISFASTSAHAEIITIDGTVKSVDAKKRTITVETAIEEMTLDVSSKAKISVDGENSAFDALKEGLNVSLAYHDQLEVVVTIEVKSSTSDENDGFVRLFDGKTLSGWSMPGLDNIHGWEAENDALVALPLHDVPLLASEGKYHDFEMACEFWLDSKGNSGIYLRGRYELQLIDDDSFPQAGPKNRCGSIVGQLAPSKAVYRGPRQWNSLAVRLERKTVTVSMNGVVIIDRQLIKEITAESLDNRENDPGPIALQNRGGLARFRNLRIRSVPSSIDADWLAGEFVIHWKEPKAGTDGTFHYSFSPKHEVRRDGSIIGAWKHQGNRFRIDFVNSDRGYVLIEPDGRDGLRAEHFWADGRRALWTGTRTGKSN